MATTCWSIRRASVFHVAGCFGQVVRFSRSRCGNITFLMSSTPKTLTKATPNPFCIGWGAESAFEADGIWDRPDPPKPCGGAPDAQTFDGCSSPDDKMGQFAEQR